MASARIVAGLALGGALGTCLGILDAATAASLAYVPDPYIYLVGASVDGACVGLLGALVAAVTARPGLPSAKLTAPLALAVLAGAGAVGALQPANGTAARTPVRDVGIVWVHVDGGAPEVLPEALVQASLLVPTAWATSSGADAAFADLLMARHAPGRRADGPTALVLAERHGLATGLFVANEGPGVQAWDRGAQEVGTLGRRHLGGLTGPRAQLALVRGVEAVVPPQEDDRTARVWAAAAAWIAAQPAPGWMAVVRVPTAEGWEAGLGSVLAATSTGEPYVAVTFGPGASAHETGLAADAVRAPMLLQLGRAGLRGQTLPAEMSALEAMPTLLGAALQADADAWDEPGVPLFNLTAWLQVRPPPGLGGEDGEECVTAHRSVRDRGFVATSADGAHAVYRQEGYALLRGPAGDLQLFDEVTDPSWSRDLLPSDPATCFGVRASTRATLAGEALDDVLQRSLAGRDRALSEDVATRLPAYYPPMPDPAALLPVR